MYRSSILLCSILCLLLCTDVCSAALINKTFDLDTSANPALDPNGLMARAVFQLDTAAPGELIIELTNTSTGVPPGFDSAAQLLTGISFDLGLPGVNDVDLAIIGGNVVVAAGARSINFDKVAAQLGPGDDLGGEWGFGNKGTTEFLPNYISTLQGGTTAFGGNNLDGPTNLSGPQGGIATDPPLVAIGGLGAVADSVIITLILDGPLADLNFLDSNGVRAEFGSDAAFLIPEPGILSLLILGALGFWPGRVGRPRQ